MREQSKTYDPSDVEERWYRFWEKEGFFKADAKSDKPPYTIVLPPPNVTGVLHMGHAMVDTLQDALIRYKRMSGYEVLWVPGTDHAGISTQTVVERHLHAKTGKRKNDFSREEFLSHVWEWKEQHQERILSQLKRLGCSCDWSRLRFTMDEEVNLSVRTIFKKMYDEKLIYRGDYLVNWDPVIQTAIADDEVEFEEQDTCFWYFRYPVENSDEYIQIATTRPETMLGDVAVAVNPTDKRYEHLVGKYVILPITNRRIPIITDHYVEKEFGTGAVKITPAHDFNDYEVGLRHNLELINIMNPDGTLNGIVKDLEGLTMQRAREEIVSIVKELGFLEKIEPHVNRVGVSYRSKAIIEPYLSKQWFVNMKPFKEKLANAVKDHKVSIVPKEWEKTYNHWIENLRDWCISRQLWWGHRIPIWYNTSDPTKMICHAGDDLPSEVKENPDNWRQDDDVLDTWFSSALWPFSTLGWPNKTEDLKKFYPNSTLITGHDILFFWVARMIMMGEYALGEVPFSETFIHGLIYGKSYWRLNEHKEVAYVLPKERLAYEKGAQVPSDVLTKWEKMSKSKGNVIDPIEIIDEYGADAMRLALCSSVTHAKQIDLDRRRFEEFKNFANKIWNASRFIFQNLTSEEKNQTPLSSAELIEGLDTSLFTLDDRWILSLLNKTILEITKAFDQYHFDEATKRIYSFFWDEFCSYYLEICKPYLFGREGTSAHRKNKQKLLVIIFTTCVRLFHPIAPYLTEELFDLLRVHFTDLDEKENIDPYTKETVLALRSQACIVAPFPKVIDKSHIDEKIETTFAFVSEIIRSIRNIRAEMQIPLSTMTDVFFLCSSSQKTLLLENIPLITSLVKVAKITEIETDKEAPPLCSTAICEDIKLFIPLPENLKEKEILRLNKEMEKAEKQIESLSKRLENQDFISKAPSELVTKVQDDLKQAENKRSELFSKLSKFSS